MAIEVYFSSVSGNLKAKKNTETIFGYLSARQQDFQQIDLSLDSNQAKKEQLVSDKGSVVLPSVYVNGKYKGGFEEFDAACEEGTDKAFFE